MDDEKTPKPKSVFSATNQPTKRRGKGRNVGQWLNLFGRSKIKFNDKFMTGNEIVAMQLFSLIRNNRDLSAMKEYMDRTEGRVVQKTELSGQVDSSTKINIIYPPEFKPREASPST